MSFVENILTPIFQLSVYVFMLGGGVWIMYKLAKTTLPDFYWTLKYKILRRKFKEKDVEWCMDAYEKEMDMWDVKRYILIKGKSLKRTDEMVYIFNQITNKLKGGDQNGKFRSGDAEIEEIQEVKD